MEPGAPLVRKVFGDSECMGEFQKSLREPLNDVVREDVREGVEACEELEELGEEGLEEGWGKDSTGEKGERVEEGENDFTAWG